MFSFCGKGKTYSAESRRWRTHINSPPSALACHPFWRHVVCHQRWACSIPCHSISNSSLKSVTTSFICVSSYVDMIICLWNQRERLSVYHQENSGNCVYSLSDLLSRMEKAGDTAACPSSIFWAHLLFFHVGSWRLPNGKGADESFLSS